MEVAEIVKNILKDPDIPEQDIQLSITEVEQAIKNYCCVPSVPQQLNFVWARMVVDLIRYDTAVNMEASSDAPDLGLETNWNITVGSINMGDTSVKAGELDYSSPKYKALNSHTADLDSIVLNYKNQLNSFRRIW